VAAALEFKIHLERNAKTGKMNLALPLGIPRWADDASEYPFFHGFKAFPL
jgi:hypothetical protein